MGVAREIGTDAHTPKNAVMREKIRPFTRRLDSWVFVTFSFTTRWRVAQGFHGANKLMGTNDYIF